MPIDTPHPAYVLRSPQWRRCRDAKAGTDAVKAAGSTYLPMLTGQTWEEYAAYVVRALYYPATERTVEGLTGLVLRRAPQVQLPDAVESDLADLTLTCQSWESVLLEQLDEAITVGALGSLVEYPVVSGATAPPADARPYWTLYKAEQIVNWRVGQFVDPTGATRTGPTRIVLREEDVRPSSRDPFADEVLARYRVLELVNGEYVCTVYHEPATEAERVLAGPGKWVADPPVTPLRRGKSLSALPFVFAGARHARPTPDKPPLLDMVDVNLSHYRSSADLEHGRHWTALPTPYVTGMTGTSTLPIGSTKAWAIADAAARVGMLEFTGAGLGSLATALEHKERLMAILGARLLEVQPMRGETAEAVGLRHAGDSATLTSLVETLNEALTMAFRWHAWWAGDDDAFTDAAKIDVALNKDFFEVPMPADVGKTALLMWQSQAISWETYFYLLQKGEWMRPGVDAEEEKAAIAAESLADGPPPSSKALTGGGGYGDGA